MEYVSKPYPGVPAEDTARVERCVNDLLKDPKFKPKDPKQSKKSAAIAVCVSSIKKFEFQEVEFKKVRAFDVTGYFEKGDSRIIEGVASTINPDLDGEQMSKEALENMVAQIKKTPIPLRSEHSDHWDDELGQVFDAYIDGPNLRIKAKLDKTSSKANDLWEKLKRGAQLGLSVAGRVKDAGFELCDSLGKEIKTFKDVLLKEISVTGRPANTMTWLSVIAKSVKLEGDIMDETTEVSTEETVEAPVEATEVVETPEAETPTETPAEVEEAVEKTDESEETTSEVQEVPEATEATAEVVEEAPVEDEVEKAGRKFSAENADKIRGLAKELMKMLGEAEDEEEPEHEAGESAATEQEERTSGKENEKTKKSVFESAEMLQKSIVEFAEAVKAERAETEVFVKSVIGQLKETEERLEKVESLPLQRKGIATPVSKAFSLTETSETQESLEKTLGRSLTFGEAYTLKMYGVDELKKSLTI